MTYFQDRSDVTEKEFGLKFYTGNNVYFCLKGVMEEMGQSMRDYRVRIQGSCHEKCHSGRENWTRAANKCKKSLNLKVS